MKRPRLLILPVLLTLAASAVTACGGGLELPPTPTATRVPVAAPDAPGSPITSSATPAATEAPEAAPTEPPAGALQPLGTPAEAPPEPTATTEPPPTAQPALGIEFDPPELVQGGTAIVYLNEPATAATLSFGGLQYPMLFDGTRWWAMIGIGAFAEPGSAPLTIAYDPADGSPQASLSDVIPIVARDFPVENIVLDEATSALLDPAIVNNEEALRASIFAGYTTQRLWDGPFQPPAAGAISSIYGVARSYNDGPVTSYHRGTDFLGSEGDPIYAAAAGQVVFVDTLQVRGDTIIIDHGVGVFTAYNHLSGFAVSTGEAVSAGQYIGQLGSTGLVTGPHLHWEVVVRGIEVDGELWLSGAVGR